MLRGDSDEAVSLERLVSATARLKSGCSRTYYIPVPTESGLCISNCQRKNTRHAIRGQLRMANCWLQLPAFKRASPFPPSLTARCCMEPASAVLAQRQA